MNLTKQSARPQLHFEPNSLPNYQPHSQPSQARQRGMTLLELLVVMVILAMVSALLVQGMGSALVTYERVQRQQQQSMQPTLAYRWFEQTLIGTQAELDKPRRFTGSSHTLSGYTHQPLIGESGQVSAFRWQLKTNAKQELELWYHQPYVKGDEVNWLILTWPAGSTGNFKYRGFDGNPASTWPAEPDNPMQQDGRIPSALFMEISLVDQPAQRWYMQLPGRPFPRSDYRDF